MLEHGIGLTPSIRRFVWKTTTMLLPEESTTNDKQRSGDETNGCPNVTIDVNGNDSDVEVSQKSRTSSVAWSISGQAEKFRTLKRRSSVENFGQFGFLVPALALVPRADGVSPKHSYGLVNVVVI